MSSDNQDEAKTELEELQAKCDEYLSGWKRSLADYENLKKETGKQLQDLGSGAQLQVLLGLLPIYDHFKLALEHVPQKEREIEWVRGLYHIKQQFESFLKNLSVKEIPTIGTAFDPIYHQAVGFEPSDREEGLIISEAAGGYQINGRVIKPAQVIVAQAKTIAPPDKNDN